MSSKKDELEMDEAFGDLFADLDSHSVEEPKHVEAPSKTKVIEEKSVESAKPDADGFIPFGKKVSSLPITRFKATTEGKARIAILSKGVLPVKTHYVEGLGNILCLEGKCCELEGMPRVRYILPVVQYEVNKQGIPVSESLEVKGLVLGAEQYDALVSAVQYSGRSITDVDIIISCSDEQYQKLAFAADASKGALWKTYPTAKETLDYFKANKSKLYMCTARSISLDVYLTSKGFVNNQPAPQPVASFDDLGLD